LLVFKTIKKKKKEVLSRHLYVPMSDRQ